MNLQQMIDAISRRVDDTVSADDAVEWLNSAKNQMAIAVEANFPNLVASALESSFVFDSKYHEIPVLYACASFKEQESTLSEASNFMAKYENLKKDFVRNYVVPPRYRDDRLSQQFTATAGQTLFTVTKGNYDPPTGDAKVYINDQPVDFETGDGKNFTLLIALLGGEAVTIIWEEHTDLIDPPYNWWRW